MAERQRYEPRYDHPAFQAAFRELTDLLASEYDGHPDVEYVDTAMYGFWGEGHTWPLEINPFPDYATAEATFVRMWSTRRAAGRRRRSRQTHSRISAKWGMLN